MKIKIQNLVPNDYNPRKLFRGAALEDLKNSIEQHGLIEPIVVRHLGNEHYEIVAGMRRYRALKELKVEDADCRVMKLNDLEAIDIAFMENIHRQNLTPIEEAKMYQIRMNKSTDSIEERHDNLVKHLVNMYSTSESTIRKRLSLLDLPQELQNALENEELPLTVAYEIARLKKIEPEDLAIKNMIEIYEDYKMERDSLSLNEINQRITRKIVYSTSKKNEQKELTEQRIKDLQNKIRETERAHLQILDQLGEKETEIMRNEYFKGDDINGDLLKFLDAQSEKYADNAEYEKVVKKINSIEDQLSDNRLLMARVREKNTRICPFCYAGIDNEAIKKKEEILIDELEDLKKQRVEIAGIKGFISDSIKELRRLENVIEKKQEFIHKFQNELEVLEGGK